MRYVSCAGTIRIVKMISYMLPEVVQSSLIVLSITVCRIYCKLLIMIIKSSKACSRWTGKCVAGLQNQCLSLTHRFNQPPCKSITIFGCQQLQRIGIIWYDFINLSPAFLLGGFRTDIISHQYHFLCQICIIPFIRGASFICFQ